VSTRTLIAIAIASSFVGCRDTTDDVAPPVPLADRAPLAATLETTEGVVRCIIEPARAPRAAAMFVGFAQGTARWRDPATGRPAHRPLYQDLSVFRATPGVSMQTGCPVGDGTGHPGYRIPVETSDDDRARLARPGALLFARYNPAPNRVDPHPPPTGHVIGSQFVVSLTDMSHLAGEHTVLGTCSDLDVVARIAAVVASKERPVRLTAVRIDRGPSDR
jgi:peptidyl-prolyl cis-trans isomerase A (cyclophilin A)